jgi:Ca2+/H+ antiporter, TMEM165/GDT1 family
MTAFLVSFLVVALAEMGDKTQLIAFSLASRYRRPWVVMSGILVATIANHALAASAGAWAGTWLAGRALDGLLGLGFLAFGAWVLVPDRARALAPEPGWGPLVSTVVIFFLAEMGDKTQLATMALGARFTAPWTVTSGTTLGMLAADSLAVFAGARLGAGPSVTAARRVAAGLFVAVGLAAILRAIGVF